MNYDPYTVFSVEHYTSSVTHGIKYVVVVVVVVVIITTTVIIICKPNSIKIVDFPAHNQQQLMR
jgi:uncharacterized membrane protein YqiK